MVNPFRRKRRVRMHLQAQVRLDRGGVTEVPGVTIEGLLVNKGRREYTLFAARTVELEGEGEAMTGYVEIPRERVEFYQRLSD